MAEPLERVAVLGTGIMGGPIARNLAATGLAVSAWNRTRERAEPLAGHGVSVAGTAADAVAGSDAVITMLTDADAVLSVMGSDRTIDAIRAGAIWLQMSTIGLEGTTKAIALADRAGARLVDAPVVGTRQPAEEGELVVLASGPADALTACRPVFEAVGARTIELGVVGAGTRMKLVVNDWLLALTAGLAETFALADALGVDPNRFLEVIEGGPVDAGYAHLKGRLMLDRDYPASFPVRLAAKDAELVLDAARDGLELRLMRAAAERFRQTAEMGLADDDMAAVYEAASPRDDRRPAAAA